MPEDGRDLILAGAILSIMLHPFIVSVIERERKEAGELTEAPAPASLAEEAPNPRIVLVGYGRVGRSDEHTYELQSIMRISYAVFCLTIKRPRKRTRWHH